MGTRRVNGLHEITKPVETKRDNIENGDVLYIVGYNGHQGGAYTIREDMFRVSFFGLYTS